jgi:hypothetical protein
MPETIGINTYGRTLPSGFTILATTRGFFPESTGVTLDLANIAGEAAVRTLPSGYVTTVAEKVIQAGTVIYQVAGTNTWRVADNTTTLNAGSVLVAVEDYSDAWDIPISGRLTRRAEVWAARLQVGGATQPTLANLRAACPGLDIKTVAS